MLALACGDRSAEKGARGWCRLSKAAVCAIGERAWQRNEENTVSTITGYHAHVYFDSSSKEQAQALCAAAGKAFPLVVGRLHDNPVGPHPRGSCQLAFPADLFGYVIPWLLEHRKGLTIFAHANTGDDIKDHTEHVVWLGPSESLNLAALSKR
jgi:aromatic ring-cleaving dioxygenase